jgi:carbon monoxide dehydrogenase subunit G
MEHEVFVPVPADHLAAALADPDRVARALPGLQRDAAAEGVAGRLKLRVAGSSVTYRGSLGVTRQDDGVFTAEAEGGEARGDGAVRATVRVTLRPRPEGTVLRFDATGSATGRITGFEPDAVRGALTRLLERFAADLPGQGGEDADGQAEGSATVTNDGHDEVVPGAGEPLVPEFAPSADGDFDARPDADDPSPAAPPEDEAGSRTGEAEAEAGEDRAAGADGGGEAGEAEEGPGARDGERPRGSVFDAPVPPSSLDPAADFDEDDTETGTGDEAEAGTEGEADDFHDGDDGDDSALFPEDPDSDPDSDSDSDAVADAAQARRTMIGRSAEEVDHAPPRGRYAPVPAPQAGVADRTLRWAAPTAAALAVAAGAVAMARVLRRGR